MSSLAKALKYQSMLKPSHTVADDDELNEKNTKIIKGKYR
jgi:hypothetical protein